jgi:energy-converting hydrogenase Eha subunit A
MREELKSRDVGIYLLASILGICAGILDLEAGDLLGTALFVLISTMVLGFMRPAKPWRWTIVVGVFVPLVRLGAYLLFKRQPERSQIYESILGFVTGIAGAYGGSVARKGLRELFGK